MTFFFLFVSILALVFLIVNLILAPHNPYQEKYSIFECGFHSFLGQNRTQFGVKFFIYAIVYLLLDLEILLTFPFALSEYANDIYGLTIALLFIIMITIGFVFELGRGALRIDSRQNIKLSIIFKGQIIEFINFYTAGTSNSNEVNIYTVKRHYSPKRPNNERALCYELKLNYAKFNENLKVLDKNLFSNLKKKHLFFLEDGLINPFYFFEIIGEYKSGESLSKLLGIDKRLYDLVLFFGSEIEQVYINLEDCDEVKRIRDSFKKNNEMVKMPSFNEKIAEKKAYLL